MSDSIKSNNKTEKRRFPRAMAPVVCRVPRILNAKKRVSDLSLGGVRIYSDEHIEVGERLELQFLLPDGSTVEAIAKVVWIKKMPPGSAAAYDVGLEFLEMTDAARDKLRAVLLTES